jgi:protein gp37
MGEVSNIAWTNSTFNPWVGCSKVGPGCDHCYAAAWDTRHHGEGAHWGPGAPRRRTTAANWSKPLRWQRDRRAALDRGEAPPPRRVFCASLADVFDNEVSLLWRQDLWRLISNCPDLEWQLVTKRVGNVAKMAPVLGFSQNVILIATIVDQAEADRDLPKLQALKRLGITCHIGVSYEPALGPVDWTPWLRPVSEDGGVDPIVTGPALDWIIVGGESAQPGQPARPFDVEWARSTIRQGREAGVPVFDKQMGSNPVGWLPPEDEHHADAPALYDRAGADPLEWPEDLRVREFPDLGVR